MSISKKTKECARRLIRSLEANINHFEYLLENDADWAIENPKEAIDLIVEAFAEKNKNRKIISPLKLIAKDREHLIDAVCGTEKFTDSRSKEYKLPIVKSVDASLEEWGLNDDEPAKPDVAVEIFTLPDRSEYGLICRQLNCGLEQLSFTRAQIVSYVRKYGISTSSSNEPPLRFILNKKGHFYDISVGYNYNDAYSWVVANKIATQKDRIYSCHLIIPKLAN